ncbi:MAG: hypothetical protein KGJ62_10790 [Armatimonadetes bacterium]|nr:hypothetical protein [Armatimonadota bacterium]MDE2206753.1 hypothetical protein [Armatimonadota bacterium]
MMLRMKVNRLLGSAWLLCLTASAIPCAAQGALPRDVPRSNWAAKSVHACLANGVMRTAGGLFRGSAEATQQDVVIALAQLGRLLYAGRWQGGPSRPVNTESSRASINNTHFFHGTVTRYVLADSLCRMADYFQNAVHLPWKGGKQLGHSAALPAIVKSRLPAGNPARVAFAYLATHRELWPDSPLLHATHAGITGDELSSALAELVVGLNNLRTPLGLDANGNTPDFTFHKRTPKSVRPGAPAHKVPGV